MTRVQIQAKIAEIELEIAKDEIMLATDYDDPEYWQHDLNFQKSLLYSYQNKLEECKC